MSSGCLSATALGALSESSWLEVDLNSVEIFLTARVKLDQFYTRYKGTLEESLDGIGDRPRLAL